MKLTREAPWAQQHADIMGPSNSYFYFGPSRSLGYLAYGNSPPQSMANARRQKKETSMYAQLSLRPTTPLTDSIALRSRYFTAQNGKEYKWKIAPQRLEVRLVALDQA